MGPGFRSIVAGVCLCVSAAAADLASLPAGPPISKPTGFFHIEKNAGRWWFADPGGRAYFMIGTDHVNYGGHACETLGYSPYGRNAAAKYGSEEAWITTQFERLSAWGFNALPYAPESMRRRKFPHVETLSLGTSFGDIDGLSPKTTWTGFPNVFSDQWPVFCDQRAKERCAAVKDDPWVLGYFLDNELEWFGTTATGLFGEAWRRPAGDSAKEAWLAFVKARIHTPQAFAKQWGVPIADWAELATHRTPTAAQTKEGKAVELAFVREVAERYFATCENAVRRYDSNHMILGCRFASKAPDIMDIAGKHCDAVTFNYYKWIDVKRGVPAALVKELTEWHAKAKKPMICTEWSFPALDAGLPCKWGGGMRVDTQAQRAQCFMHFQTMLFSLPFIVGSNYFMYIDEPAQGISHTFPEDSNYGLIDVNDNPYPALTHAAADLNAKVYEIHQRGKLPQMSGTEQLARWLTHPPRNRRALPSGAIRLTTGSLTIEGPIDGHAWRLRRGDVLLGDLVAYIEQDVGNWLWVPTDSARIAAIREDKRAVVVDMELASEGKGPMITRITPDPSRPPADKLTPGRYRGMWRFVVPKDDSGWISMQCLWFENTGGVPWTSRMAYQFLLPSVGGSPDSDRPLYAPDMHDYYMTGAAWVDDNLHAGIGCWYRPQQGTECTFWIDQLGRYRSDMRHPAAALLQPGQRYASDGPLAFFFPLDGTTRDDYERQVEQIRATVLTAPRTSIR